VPARLGGRQAPACAESGARRPARPCAAATIDG